MSNLILFDLPGLVSNEQGLQQGTMRKIERIVKDYLHNITDRNEGSTNDELEEEVDRINSRSKPEEKSNGISGTIILAITASNSDKATSGAIHLAERYDQSGRNTIHVLTKLDILDRGVRADELLEGFTFPGRPIGVVGVVNRAQQDLDGRLDLLEARRKEEKFFKENCPKVASKQGIPTLRKLLTRVLKERLELELPKIKELLQNREKELSLELNNFPTRDLKSMESFSSKQMLEIYKKVNTQLLGKLRLKPQQENYQIFGAKIYDYLQNQFQTDLKNIYPVDTSNLTNEDIKNAIKNSRGIQGPVFIANEAFINLCSRMISQLKEPCLNCEKHIFQILYDGVMAQIDSETLSNFPILKQKFEEIVSKELEKRHVNAKSQVEFLLKMEDSNIVVNDEEMKKLASEVLSRSAAQENGNEASTQARLPPAFNREVKFTQITV